MQVKFIKIQVMIRTFKFPCIFVAMLLLAGARIRGAEPELPRALSAAIERVEAGDAGSARLALLRRHANSDVPGPRLAARLALARHARAEGTPALALPWIEEYARPLPEHRVWPVIEAHVECALIQLDLGRAYEAVSTLNSARENSEGLARIVTLRALSQVFEKQPDIKQALAAEQAALRHGDEFFRRQRDSEGLLLPRSGTERFLSWRPDMEARIEHLQRLLDIEHFGLDYVLYAEAQHLRKADHPLALDFTRVEGAFRGSASPAGPRIPGADFEAALEKYREITDLFPGNPYGEAARLHAAICLMHLGRDREAVRELMEFYRDSPDGLYRGEALKILGDIHLFHRWDRRNAREAYERAARWLEAMQARTRVLDTYLVPEASEAVSRPPRIVQVLTPDGVIQRKPVPVNALVNRSTAPWYLGRMLEDVRWRMGFLEIVENNWEGALEIFEANLRGNDVLAIAQQNNFFNPFMRLEIAARNQALMAYPEQMQGLRDAERTVMLWADLQFLLEEFEAALDLYRRIQQQARAGNRTAAYTRAVLGEMHTRNQLRQINPERDIPSLHELVRAYPRSPSAPALLEVCATHTPGEPLDRLGYLRWMYEQYPRSPYAPAARYYEILHGLTWDQHAQRADMIRAFTRDFPDQDGHIDALKRYDHIVRNLETNKHETP